MIIRNQVSKDFTVVRNEVLNRMDLSLGAKGLYCFLMTKPDGWEISIRGLCKQVKEGKDAVATLMKELNALGYYSHIRKQRPDGKVYWENTIYDIPPIEPEDQPKKCAAIPCPAEPDTAKPPQVNTNKVNTVINTSTYVDGSRAASEATYGRQDINQLFEQWEHIVGYKITGDIKNNRKAAYNLLRLYQPHDIERLLRVTAQASTNQFAPRISDLVSLQKKMNELVAWVKRQRSSMEVI